jgi:hypothetical protein
MNIKLNSSLGLLVYFLSKLLKLFGLPTFWLWANLLKVIPESVVRTKFDIYVLIKLTPSTHPKE